ncbi:MAG TPA: hypothetical protein DHV15_06870 [Treponema sp.]|uniref:Uncharacterized protein n=1 Tax=Treponema denticola (strain ATCC 35405 / DSM 14222 / CIP 103919 / JCM 8153 / KCTC 15104) TaxID=243275 RepID=Q73L38_TREDE|nr:hypothetical protein TDE_2027 [Treponema denticola ATCC 35405]HCY95223.1 hypothetical protein [Treponema sp.]
MTHISIKKISFCRYIRDKGTSKNFSFSRSFLILICLKGNLSNTLPIKMFYWAVIVAFKGAQYDFFKIRFKSESFFCFMFFYDRIGGFCL